MAAHLRQKDVNCGVPQLVAVAGVGRGQVGKAACQHGCARICELHAKTVALNALRLVLGDKDVALK